MPAKKSIHAMLAPGRRLDAGRVAEVVALVAASPRRFSQLVECLWDEDAALASRAADAVERITRERPRLAERYVEPLLGLMSETSEKKIRWNLALTVARLRLGPSECRRAAAILESYLDDRSSIVKTSALHGLADLADQDPALLPGVLDLLRVAGRSGTPAMRARSRILLAALEKTGRKGRQRASLHMFD